MIKKIKGFTLLEITLVIGIIAVLAVIVFVAINPSDRISKTNNANRWSDVESISDSINLYQWDHNGALPSGVDSSLRMIGTDVSGCDVSCGNTGTTSSIVDDTQSEFSAGIYMHTKWDSSNSVLKLDATGMLFGSGSYDSIINDAGSESAWTTLAWNPSAPYYKELPNNAQVESAYSAGNVDMSDNIFLAHMNGTSSTILDESGEGNNGVCSGAISPIPGKIDGARDFDGISDYITADGVASDLNGLPFSVSLWIKPSSTQRGTIAGFHNNGANRNLLFWAQDGASNKVYAYSSSVGYVPTTDTFTVSNWHHVVWQIDSSGNGKIYVDNTEQASWSSANTSAANQFSLGQEWDAAVASDFFYGAMDEVAVFNRTLSTGEISNIYTRGIDRLKFQVRSCDDSSCSGESFMGPDGTSSTYYTELSNSSVLKPSLTLTNVPSNQYFQYEIDFETDNSSYLPTLMSISIDYNENVEFTEAVCLDLSTELADYLPVIPEDSDTGSAGKTFYAVKINSSDASVKVVSCSPELDETISKSR